MLGLFFGAGAGSGGFKPSWSTGIARQPRHNKRRWHNYNKNKSLEGGGGGGGREKEEKIQHIKIKEREKEEKIQNIKIKGEEMRKTKRRHGTLMVLK